VALLNFFFLWQGRWERTITIEFLKREGREIYMPTLSITIPSSLDVALRNTAAKGHTSPDNLVSAALSEYLGYHRPRIFRIYTLRVEGVFETVHTRVLSPIAPGTGLVEAARAQAEFHFRNILGRLVCIWSPSYSSAFNVPGYHFHFISNDRTKGGHVLDWAAEMLDIRLQMLCEYDVRLPSEGTFLTARLSQDPSADLAKVE
jgi:alpha-acetolactate decarboxylase